MTTLNGSTISTVITRALGRNTYQSATQVFVIIANYSNLGCYGDELSSPRSIFGIYSFW